MSNMIRLLTTMLLLLASSVCPAQSVRYEFTGGSMTPTFAGLPAGVTASNFSLGTFTIAALSDNGGSGNSLRFSRGDIGTSSATALAGPCLSFSLTIPIGIKLNLNSLALDFTSAGVKGNEYINSRGFSSIAGFDDLIADTIGTLGRVANGADSGTTTLSLTAPDSNPGNGNNANNGDFQNLTNRTITFFLPFIRDSQTTATDYVDIDNITLTFTAGDAEISNFTATAISSFETGLAWDESFSDETSLIIERSVTGSGVWETTITTEPNVTSIGDLTMPPGASYTYRISAALSAGGFSPTVISGSVVLPPVPSAPLRIMPLGDSITKGEGAVGGYRDPLYASLTSAGVQMQYIGARTDNATTLLSAHNQTRHEGRGGYSTDLLLGNLDTSTPYGGTNNGGYWITGIAGIRVPVHPDLILLMIGTNDIGLWGHSPAETIAYYDQLLTKLVTLRPSAHIICASIVPFVLSKFEQTYPEKIGVYTQREPNNVIFNSLLPGLVASHQAAGHRVQFYDMRQKINPANAPTLIGGDGVHPNSAGYIAIASGWFEAMKELPLIASWRIKHFNTSIATGNAADLADPDSDGAPNFREYALGTDPMIADNSAPNPIFLQGSGANYLSTSFPRRKNADARYTVEVSSDLVSWSPDTLQAGSPAAVNPDFEQVTFRDRQPTSANLKRFIRLRVSRE